MAEQFRMYVYMIAMVQLRPTFEPALDLWERNFAEYKNRVTELWVTEFVS